MPRKKQIKIRLTHPKGRTSKIKKAPPNPIELSLKRCFPDVHHFNIPAYQYSQVFTFYGSNLNHLEPGTKILMHYIRHKHASRHKHSSILFTVLNITPATSLKEGDKMIALPDKTSFVLMYYNFVV